MPIQCLALAHPALLVASRSQSEPATLLPQEQENDKIGRMSADPAFR